MRTLMSFLMRRLHSLETPTIRHREAEKYSDDQLGALIQKGILTKVPEQDEGTFFAAGSVLGYRRTPQGLYAVANDEDDFIDPYLISEDDIGLYEISSEGLVKHLRTVNEIVGNGGKAEYGLIPLGEKHLTGFGAIDVSLSLPNADVEVFAARCLALRKPSGVKCVAVLLPIPVALPSAVREQIDGRDITLISLLPSADQGHFRIDWNNVIISSASGRRADGFYPPRTLVFRGLEYSDCELTKDQAAFMDIALRHEAVEIKTLYSRAGKAVWQGTFVNDRTGRNKISQFLTRLNTKLCDASVPLGFSLPEGRQTIVRSQDGTQQKNVPLADSSLTKD